MPDPDIMLTDRDGHRWRLIDEEWDDRNYVVAVAFEAVHPGPASGYVECLADVETDGTAYTFWRASATDGEDYFTEICDTFADACTRARHLLEELNEKENLE